MSDLAARVLAAIDETEEIAQAAADEGIDSWKPEDPAYWWNDDYPMSQNEKRLIAMHDPAAVLRRCAADRQVLGLYEGTFNDPTAPSDSWATIRAVVAALAEGYGITEEAEA